jgi:hypothetical protein
MRTRYFWLSALERCLKTAAQTLISMWVVGGVMFDLRAVDWPTSLSVAGGAALISLLMSVASSSVGPDGSPSLVGEPPKQPDALLEPEPPDPEDETPSGRHVLDDDPDDRPVSGFRTHPSATRFRHPQD